MTKARECKHAMHLWGSVCGGNVSNSEPSLIAAVYVLAWTKNLADHNPKKNREEKNEVLKGI